MKARSPRKAPAAKTRVPPPPPPGNLRRAALALAAIWALLFAPQLFAGRGFVIGDAGSIRAFAEFSATRWSAHHTRTHWNPYIFAGLPATVSLQDSRPQWLPDPLLTAFDAIHRLPGFPPLAIPLAVHLAGMIATAALARRLWGAGTLAMVFAGTAWGLLPGQLVPFAFGQDWLLMSIALMPVVLLAIARFAAAASARARLAGGLGLALAVAAMFLAAHPQIIALTLPVAAAFSIERSRREGRLATLGAMVAFAALGVAMATVVWWPAQLYNAHSVRGAEAGGVSLGEVNAWSAGLVDLVALFWPWAAGFGHPTYWGALHATDFPQFIGTSIFALGLLGLARRDGARRAAWLLVAMAVASALLAVGIHLGPAYLWMYDHVPLFSSFRVAIRSLIVAQLAFALLAARGLEVLFDSARHDPARWQRIAAWAAGGAVAAALLLYIGPLAGMYAGAVVAARPAVDLAAAREVARRAALDLGARGLGLAALVALFTWSGAAAARARSLAVVLLVALDLGVVSVPFMIRATGSVDRLAHPDPPTIARLASADPASRVLDVTPARRYSNDWIRWRARSLTGNHPAVPREWNETWDAASRSYGGLCALSIRWLGGGGGAPPDTAQFRAIADPAGGPPLWELRRARPRAAAVASVVRLDDERAVLAAMASPGFDPGRVALTSDAEGAGDYPGSASCRIAWAADDPDHLELETRADSAAFVVIADTWFPGWRATLDGRAVPIHRVQHLLRGIAVPAGTHRLRLDYEPEGWAAGVRATWAAWALWLALGAVAAVGFRPRAAAASPRAAAASGA